MERHLRTLALTHGDIRLLQYGCHHLAAGGDAAGRQRRPAHLEVRHEVEGSLAGAALHADRSQLPAADIGVSALWSTVPGTWEGEARREGSVGAPSDRREGASLLF